MPKRHVLNGLEVTDDELTPSLNGHHAPDSYPRKSIPNNNNNNNRRNGPRALIGIILVTAIIASLVTHWFDQNNNNNNKTKTKTKMTTSWMDSIESLIDMDPMKSKAPWPRAAWLMSYPNSGTTYTGYLVMGITNRTTAANYGQECDVNEDGLNVPIHTEYTNGPFYKDLSMDRPKKGYVLTKTHCGGRCSWCPAESFVETPRSFKARCAESDKMTPGNPNSHGKERTTVLYDPDDIIFKAVHLIRDPIDNLVARLHHSRKKHGADQAYVTNYTDTPEGFQRWCQDKDNQFATKDKDSRFIDDLLLKLKPKVTCFNELYKYVQWHNLAFATTQGMGIPVHVLHYENYTHSFDRTVHDLVQFLEVDVEGKAPEFVTGKEYHHYYPKSDYKAAIKFMKKLSSQKTWSQIQHYLK